jgi:arginine decarboxylase
LPQPNNTHFGPEEAEKLYDIRAWGGDYFAVDSAGQITVRTGNETPISLLTVIQELERHKHSTPMILRFSQILEDRLDRLNQAFAISIREANYQNHYQGVYPIKVNQRQMVVETLAEHGVRYRTGLEAGSKAELALILIQDIHEDALICCNGFKDDDFIRMALWGRKLGKNVVITLEKYVEIDRVLRISRELDISPAIGIRFKLHSRGAGRWKESSGDDAKFGLTTAEMLRVALRLRETGLADCLQMLHCHLGSQVTDVRRIKVATREATQAYVELTRMNISVKYLNLGGGLAVDYDGSKTNFHASANYALQDYADSVVWTVAEVCNEGDVAHPILVTESGRALTAHHAIFVFPIVDTIRPSKTGPELPPPEGKHLDLVKEMSDLVGAVSKETYREIYYDAVTNKDTMHSLFDLGYLNLIERAHIERSYYAILERISQVIADLDYIPEDFEELPKILGHKYVGNFSVFQAIPDHWAIKALFPVVPLHRLDQRPECSATLVDISCDSDGKINQFIDLREDFKAVLPLHPLKEGETYYLGIFLTGAYQDVLANSHNLLGRVNEAHIRFQNGTFKVENVVAGQKAQRVIENMGYDTHQLHKWLLETIAESDAPLPKGQKRKFIELYDRELVGYTYLEDI